MPSNVRTVLELMERIVLHEMTPFTSVFLSLPSPPPLFPSCLLDLLREATEGPRGTRSQGTQPSAMVADSPFHFRPGRHELRSDRSPVHHRQLLPAPALHCHCRHGLLEGIKPIPQEKRGFSREFPVPYLGRRTGQDRRRWCSLE